MARTSAILALALCGLFATAFAETTVIDNWYQCGGMGADCGQVGACADAAYPDHECQPGWSCQRQNGYYWQCLEGAGPEIVVVGELAEYAQCGGAGGDCHNLPYALCEDKAWTGPTCVEGSTCERQNEYYWQCLVPAPTPSPGGEAPAPSPAPTPTELALYAQCGGMGGNCADYESCIDAEFPNVVCAADTTCQRQNEYYYQCLAPEVVVQGSPAIVAPYEISQWGQCGGMGGNCTTASYGVCADAAYPNTACEFGNHCDRQNEYYWQCL